jgi:hypothetical protein
VFPFRCLMNALLIISLGSLGLASPLFAMATPKQYGIRFDVSWEILRSGFNSSLDVALEADTYGESWALQVQSPYEMHLITPRGKARVIGLKTQLDSPSDNPFDTVVLSERQFAKLLGIRMEAIDTVSKDIFIELPVVPGDEQTFILKANPKYFVSVTLHIQL